MALEFYDLVLILLGVAVLGTGLLPRYVQQLPLSRPLIWVAFGFAIFSLPLGLPSLDPVLQGEFTERITEFGVIIALMVAGLKLDRPPGLRGWESTWRLIGITMPVTIGLAALVGWWVVGLTIPSAMLLGAVIAPTDPVLASEVQVEGPEGSDEDEMLDDADGGEDEARFALTSEAGLNDGFAFPFTYLAIAMALMGVSPGNWVGEWFLVDVLFRIAVGLAVGAGLGWVMAKLVFVEEISPEAPMARSLLGVEALGATLLVYGFIEFIGGYGFIGVFVAAVTIRNYEYRHAYYDPLHDVAEQAEQLTMAAIMILFGGLIASGLFAPLTWELVVASVLIVLVVRPVSGIVALLGFDRSWAERLVISFYGLRGIGTFYYLAYALNEAAFRDANVLWAVSGLAVLLSVVLGGITATPVVEEWLGESPEVETPDTSG
ncbi:cation:proton antiporter [Halopelagius longus]|uniref:Sodium/proton antiporter, CPA1 family n=1 Tax=Halopelagius longus TaxID=1236180 RepID=A0A1H0Y6J4_9EURY|nr:cation:proton antiporter [Halopelagius longus]RDI72303.1 sodium:proton antiporter [Halopelagius longus]SDQ10710.1 sodium/proton antiporter, CPA1 family [Halopelagius longus]